MRKIFVLSLVVLSLIFGAVLFSTIQSDRALSIQQAEGVIESARAAQEASKAAQIASAGLSTVSVVNSLLLALMVVVLIAIAGMLAYVLIKQSASVRQSLPQPSRKQSLPRLPDQTQLLTMLLMQQLMSRQPPKSETPIMLDEQQDIEYLGW